MPLVPLDTAKAHLRVLDASEDALIALYVAAAEDQAAQYLGRNVYASAVDPLDLTGIVLNASIEAAVLLIAGSLYSLREDMSAGLTVQSLPMGAHALLQPYRTGLGV